MKYIRRHVDMGLKVSIIGFLFSWRKGSSFHYQELVLHYTTSVKAFEIQSIYVIGKEVFL